jgi:hypothetical protein
VWGSDLQGGSKGDGDRWSGRGNDGLRVRGGGRARAWLRERGSGAIACSLAEGEADPPCAGKPHAPGCARTAEGAKRDRGEIRCTRHPWRHLRVQGSADCRDRALPSRMEASGRCGRGGGVMV